jgi:cell division protein ZapA
MCAASRVVKVTILGREYAFASQGEEADAHVRRVAGLIDERMREVSRRSQRQAPLQVAVLTGLELVDELLQLQREADEVEEQIAARTSRLSDTLGQLLGDVAEDDEVGSEATYRFEAEWPETQVPATPRFRTDDISVAADGSKDSTAAIDSDDQSA